MVGIGMNSRALIAAACCGLGLAVLPTAPSASADPASPSPQPPAPVAPTDAAAAPVGVPHLSSPQNLPPGTTDVPLDPPQGRRMSYLRDLWHAVQTQEIKGGDALLLLTQRPMDANAVPPPGMPAGPQPPAPTDAPIG